MGLLIILKGNDFFTTAHKHVALHLLCRDNKLANENVPLSLNGNAFPHFLNSKTNKEDTVVIVTSLIILALVLLTNTTFGTLGMWK